TSCATRALPPRRAARDADCVRRLREAGAIPFGKTNLLEFAYGIAHPAFGQTNNPCDPTRTAGGSSGGSAAAVAAGIVPLALGTDTGGSVRAPAAYCGIVGFKPSFGLLSLEGVYPLSPSLDHLGLLGRTVADVALGLAALAPSPATDAGDVASIRLGVCRSQWDSPALRPQVRLAGNAALGRLKSASVTMVDIALPSPELMTAALLDILLPEAALVHAQTYRDSASGYAPGTAAQIEAGLVLPAVRYLDAKRHQQRWTAELGTLFEAVDAIISPTVRTSSPSASIAGEIRPACTTAMRSERANNSSRSSEISSTAAPSGSRGDTGRARVCTGEQRCQQRRAPGTACTPSPVRGAAHHSACR
ncbi:MAG: amidase, partial [Starkeya sp.]|nr:amidase [Starkeya sp.]